MYYNVLRHGSNSGSNIILVELVAQIKSITVEINVRTCGKKTPKT